MVEGLCMLVRLGLLTSPLRRLIDTFAPSVVATAGEAEKRAHPPDAVGFAVLLDEGVHHFRLFAKYTAVRSTGHRNTASLQGTIWQDEDRQEDSPQTRSSYSGSSGKQVNR